MKIYIRWWLYLPVLTTNHAAWDRHWRMNPNATQRGAPSPNGEAAGRVAKATRPRRRKEREGPSQVQENARAHVALADGHTGRERRDNKEKATRPRGGTLKYRRARARKHKKARRKKFAPSSCVAHANDSDRMKANSCC